MPLGSIILNATQNTTQTVFIQKQNIEASGILAFNQALAQIAEKNKDLKTRADAIDAYFEKRNMPLFGMGMKMVQGS